MKQWRIYRRKYDYAADYHWEDIVKRIEQLFKMVKGFRDFIVTPAEMMEIIQEGEDTDLALSGHTGVR